MTDDKNLGVLLVTCFPYVQLANDAWIVSL